MKNPFVFPIFNILLLNFLSEYLIFSKVNRAHLKISGLYHFVELLFLLGKYLFF